MGNLLDEITQVWVKLTGKRIHASTHHWLIGPVGDTDVIADKFAHKLAQQQGLQVLNTPKDAGLLNSISDLGISPNEKANLHPSIAHFYEHTANYQFEFWSEWKCIFSWFGSLLAFLFSKRLQQLNLPLNAIDSSRGIKSEILKLVNPTTKKAHWTVWYRKLNSNQRVIYSGLYTSCKHPNYERPLLKVIFPLPNGSASVVMRAEVKPDGSLMLISDGKRFGDNGFYFTLSNHKGKHWARFVRAMHEWIHVYVDETNTLRADHSLNIWGMRFLNLHYKMTQKVA